MVMVCAYVTALQGLSGTQQVERCKALLADAQTQGVAKTLREAADTIVKSAGAGAGKNARAKLRLTIRASSDHVLCVQASSHRGQW